MCVCWKCYIWAITHNNIVLWDIKLPHYVYFYTLLTTARDHVWFSSLILSLQTCFSYKTYFISNSIQKMEVPMQIFRGYFPSSFGAEIHPCPTLSPHGHFFKFQTDNFALKDREKHVLKICMGTFLSFRLLFEFSLQNMFRMTKISWKTIVWKTRPDPEVCPLLGPITFWHYTKCFQANLDTLGNSNYALITG